MKRVVVNKRARVDDINAIGVNPLVAACDHIRTYFIAVRILHPYPGPVRCYRLKNGGIKNVIIKNIIIRGTVLDQNICTMLHRRRHVVMNGIAGNRVVLAAVNNNTGFIITKYFVGILNHSGLGRRSDQDTLSILVKTAEIDSVAQARRNGNPRSILIRPETGDTYTGDNRKGRTDFNTVLPQCPAILNKGILCRPPHDTYPVLGEAQRRITFAICSIIDARGHKKRILAWRAGIYLFDGVVKRFPCPCSVLGAVISIIAQPDIYIIGPRHYRVHLTRCVGWRKQKQPCGYEPGKNQ